MDGVAKVVQNCIQLTKMGHSTVSGLPLPVVCSLSKFVIASCVLELRGPSANAEARDMRLMFFHGPAALQHAEGVYMQRHACSHNLCCKQAPSESSGHTFSTT